MKPARFQIQFLVWVLVWTVLLQGIMLWYLSTTLLFVCNSAGPWPLSAIPVLGSYILTFLLAFGLSFWAWKSLAVPSPLQSFNVIWWALIVGSGVSHTLERLTSNCVLDYWHLSFVEKTLHFNLGDVSLTIGAIALVSSWLWEYRRKF